METSSWRRLKPTKYLAANLLHAAFARTLCSIPCNTCS
ncbi:hypothetical protein GQ600_12664 [Phytophthora cactorum]|nr:hypothetical protein GQ600_12664 [Phytophthora cactorum]